jgi:small-conductance mechanosensitive channel
VVIENVLSWLTGSSLSGPFVLVVIAVAALVTTRVSRLVIRRVIRRLATRTSAMGTLVGDTPGFWQARSRRVGGETGETGEQRRRQRIDAASRMVNHLVAVVVWIVAAIVAFHLLAIDPAFFLSSAGFIGAGLAIGGQHKVNDYLTGLSVHFEDRYGIGDEVVVHVAGWAEPVRGVVDHIGLFSTRLRDDRSTLHFPNAALANLRNLSQEAASETLRLRVPDDVHPAAAAELLRGLAGTDGLTDVVFVGDLAARDGVTGEVEVDVLTSRALDGRARRRLVGRAERALVDMAGGEPHQPR